MENNVDVKEEDNSAEEIPATMINKLKTDNENIPVTEKKSLLTDAKPVADCETVVNENTNGDSAATEDHDLNLAMASATISTPDADEDQQNQCKTILYEEQQKQVMDSRVAEANCTIDDANESPNASINTLGMDEKTNLKVNKFEDKHELDNDNEDGLEKTQRNKNVNRQECVSDAGDGVDDEVDDEESLVEELKEPVVPVPVDDDTNDPQYIPRRGRFYEHDDRMAYSTTSSECSDDYEEDSEYNDENDTRPIRRRRTSGKKNKSMTAVDAAENTNENVTENTQSSKKVLAISKVASTAVVNSSNASMTGGSAKKPGGFRKSRDIDSLSKWSHDMYNEREQTPKSKDELLASYGYDIREESEAPRARRHHKYGRAATTKYTRNWQDTRAYISSSSSNQASGKSKSAALNKNQIKSSTDEYTSEFPPLDNSKCSSTTENSEHQHQQQQQQPQPQPQPQQQQKFSAANQERNTISPGIGPSRHQGPSTKVSTKFKTSPPTNQKADQENENSSPTSFPSNNKNYFNRSSLDKSSYPIDTEKGSIQSNHRESSTPSNFYNRKPPHQNIGQNPSHNYKQTHYNNNNQGNQSQEQRQYPSANRFRNFHQNNNGQHQYNRDRYFSKGSNLHQPHFDHPHHNNIAPITAGTGRTQHSGHYNRQFENDNQQPISVPPPPLIRSSKRYSVQSRRELPDPVLNFGGMSNKIPQPQQQNGLLVQDQSQTMQQIQSQQMQPPPPPQLQPPMQIHQQQPMQIPQYHQTIQQLHPHHSMVLDHNTGMMVVATADPTMYHQLYAAPQYTTTVTPGSTTSVTTDDLNATAAASALQMLATQAAVYQPVPTNVVSPSNTQSESFMTTYYQPMQQPHQQQHPPRRVNLAIPIVAPPDSNPQQNTQKSNASSTPPPTATSTN